jgi:hypothetical protein
MTARHLKLVPRKEPPDLSQEHRRRQSDIVHALENLLDRARDGQFRGFLWVTKSQDGQHQSGTTGDYNADLEDAAKAAFMMLNEIHQLPRTPPPAS